MAPSRARANARRVCARPVPIRWNLHGFGYVQVMFDTVTSHDARCSSGTGMSPTQKNPFRMLQIGLGGGTFAMNAMRKCHAVVDVIEGQPDVAAMAQRFLGFSTGGQLIVADGFDGLKTLATAAEAKGGAGSLYDAIAVDCMVKDRRRPDARRTSLFGCSRCC